MFLHIFPGVARSQHVPKNTKSILDANAKTMTQGKKHLKACNRCMPKNEKQTLDSKTC